MFRASGITWSSSGGCSDRNNPTCTSFDQLNRATAQGAQTLKSASGCGLNITGGTETGHASGTYSHGNGYKLDFGKATWSGGLEWRPVDSLLLRGSYGTAFRAPDLHYVYAGPGNDETAGFTFHTFDIPRAFPLMLLYGCSDLSRA